MPLRSALLVIASSRHTERRRVSLVMTISSTSTDSSTSIQAWTMPGPSGPSRSNVGGTMSQPLASETRNAARSRLPSVPMGKSSSGRSPRRGLYTASVPKVPSLTWARNVALVASVSRPTTSISPCASSASMAARSAGASPLTSNGSSLTPLRTVRQFWYPLRRVQK